MRIQLLLAAGLAATLAACASTPKPIPEKVTIVTQPVDTCVPMSALRQVVIPAKTKTVYSVNEIDNGPYDPISSKEEHVIEITPEQVYYVDTEGRQVTDICDVPVTPETMAR